MGNVNVQQDVCIGCKYCIPACPYGVISFSEKTGTVHKCTLCNDRIHNGLGTACAKACPTGSISFGEVAELKKKGGRASGAAQGPGIYQGEHLRVQRGRRPECLLPLPGRPCRVRPAEHPVVPQRRLFRSAAITVVTAIAVAAAAIMSFRERGMKETEKKGSKKYLPRRRGLFLRKHGHKLRTQGKL